MAIYRFLLEDLVWRAAQVEIEAESFEEASRVALDIDGDEDLDFGVFDEVARRIVIARRDHAYVHVNDRVAGGYLEAEYAAQMQTSCLSKDPGVEAELQAQLLQISTAPS